MEWRLARGSGEGNVYQAKKVGSGSDPKSDQEMDHFWGGQVSERIRDSTGFGLLFDNPARHFWIISRSLWGTLSGSSQFRHSIEFIRFSPNSHTFISNTK